MWKIVKAELSYVKPVLLLSAGFFLGIALLIWLHVDAHDIFESEYYMLPCIILSHVIINCVLLYFEIKESRLRQVGCLPLPMLHLGLARIVTPLALLGIHLLLYAVCFLIPFSKFPIAGFQALCYEYRHHEVVVTDPGYFVLRVRWYMPVQQLYYLGLGLFVTYAFRLWTEWYGRVLLVLCVLFVLVHGLIIPLFEPKIAYAISDAVYGVVFPSPTGFSASIAGTVAVILGMGFICVIYISFMRRRSYLQ